MKTIKTFLILAILGGAFTAADAQYYYGPPPPGPAPAPRHRQERQERTDDEVSQPSGYFVISIGLAQPVGGFANGFGGTATNGTTYQPGITYPTGYAQAGLNFNVSLGIPVEHSNLGIALQYSSCTNPFDIGTYANNVAATDPNRQYDGGDVSSAYSTDFIMAGLFATLPIQRLSFDFKLMGGIALCGLPEVAYSAQQWDAVLNQYDQYSWDISGSNSTSFAFGIGGDLRYKFRRASLMLGVDFLSTTPTVNSQEKYTDPNGANYYTHVSGIAPISVINTYIGIAYQLR